jgi:hypothetical protein
MNLNPEVPGEPSASTTALGSVSWFLLVSLAIRIAAASGKEVR